MIDAQGSVHWNKFCYTEEIGYAINSFEASKAAFELSLIFSCEENCNKNPESRIQVDRPAMDYILLLLVRTPFHSKHLL